MRVSDVDQYVASTVPAGMPVVAKYMTAYIKSFFFMSPFLGGDDGEMTTIQTALSRLEDRVGGEEVVPFVVRDYCSVASRKYYPWYEEVIQRALQQKDRTFFEWLVKRIFFDNPNGHNLDGSLLDGAVSFRMVRGGEQYDRWVVHTDDGVWGLSPSMEVISVEEVAETDEDPPGFFTDMLQRSTPVMSIVIDVGELGLGVSDDYKRSQAKLAWQLFCDASDLIALVVPAYFFVTLRLEGVPEVIEGEE